MSQSEISFYKKKKLSLPKRCKECRELNKAKKNGQKEADNQNQGSADNDKTSKKVSADNNKTSKKVSANKKRLAYFAAAVIIALGGGGTAISTMSDAPAEDAAIEQTVELEDTTMAVEIDVEESAEAEQVAGTDTNAETTYVDAEEKEDETAELTDVVIEHEFRNEELFENHYKKHGIEMGFDSPEKYLAGANRVIASPDVLHKIEKEDGDDIYYLEASNEFVVVSKDGYLRTYFKPSDGIDYYNRQ
jgi:pyocin large subunit-like protein